MTQNVQETTWENLKRPTAEKSKQMSESNEVKQKNIE